MNEAPGSDTAEIEHDWDAGVVCTVCLEANPPEQSYCFKCGALLNSLRAFNPFDQTLVKGFAYRRAVDGPPSRVIVGGMWLLFFPPCILAIAELFADFFHVVHQGVLAALLRYVFPIVYILTIATVLYRTTANYLTKRNPSATKETADAS